jgi:cytochrome c-type biogenesis protein
MMEETINAVPGAGQALFSGLLSFLSPGALVLVPVALLCAAGFAAGERAGGDLRRDWRRTGETVLYLAVFLAGFIAVSIGIAVGQTFIGRVLLSGQRVLMALGGLLTLVLGLFMAGVVPSPSVIRPSPHRRLPRGAAVAAVGGAMALSWAPCAGPVLGSLILAAGSPETSGRGVPFLALHGLGFGFPLLVAGYLLDGGLQRLRVARVSVPLVKVSGAALMLAGLLLALGRMPAVVDGFFRFFGGWTQLLIEGGL